MASNSKTYDLGVIFTGQTICVPVEHIKNTSGVVATDVIVKLDKVPDGLEYASSQLARGTFDPISRIWTIGTMSPGESLSGLLCFTVLDDSQEPFSFNFIVGLSDYCETCETPNSYCVIVKGISCIELYQCGMIRVEDGTYDDDADAAAAGIEIGEYYELSAENLYGLPEGQIKRRIN